MVEKPTIRLLLISNMYPGKADPAYGVFVRNIEQGLIQNGVAVDRIVIAGRGRNWLHKIWKYIIFYGRIWTARFSRYDVIQVGYPSHSYLPMLFRRLKRTLLAVRFHGLDLVSDPGEEGVWDRIGRWFARMALRRADVVVVPSRYFEKEIKRQHEPATIHVYPSGGVDLDRFRPNGSNELRRTIGFVGRLDPLKGTDVFLRGLACSNEPLQGIIAGQGSLRAEMETLSAKLGLSDRVRFIGWIPNDQLCDVYNQMDLFVFPTMRKAESFGNVAIEAMACGLPVIGSRMAGLTEYIRDGENGFFVEPGNPEALSKALGRYYGLSEQERARLKQNAIETARRFEQKTVSGGYVSRLIQLIESSKR